MLTFAVATAAPVTAHTSWVDYLIIAIYFVVTLGIGFVLRTRMRSSEDFFLAGRSLPSWVTGLAFVGANLGALEILGMGANAAQYGILQAHFYWIGAIPAMIFVAIFMMPFYYGSKTHSVPGFLKLRYNEATRGFNAITFGILTLLTSGINMYAAALVFNVLLGWSLTACIWLSALFIMVYILLGGLSSSIYNETLQFFLIVAGLAPLTIIGLINVGGWSGLQAKVNNPAFFHLWAGTASNNNPFGVNFIGIAFGNASYSQSDGININLWWGLLMLVFGLLMSAGGYISARRQRARGDTMQPPQSATPQREQEGQSERRTT